MNPVPNDEEYEAMMAEQADIPGAGYGSYESAATMPAESQDGQPEPPPPASMPAPRVAMPMQPQFRPHVRQMPVGAFDPNALTQPIVNAVESVTNPEAVVRGHMLGFSTIATGLGMLLGVRLGGGYGAVAGSLFAGSAVNAYRAAIYGKQGTAAGRKEAVISGTYAVIAAGIGGYVLYKFKPKAPQMKQNRREDGPSCLTRNEPRSCGIRAII